LGLTKCKKKFTKPFSKKSDFDARLHLCNDLEEVTASKYPVIASIKKRLLNCGAVGALMSGSGPTVFGLFSDSVKAEKAKRIFDADVLWDVYASKIINEVHYQRN
jgi:4-diphosphocytidyl-2-C-methyl-D-erythritol kinase